MSGGGVVIALSVLFFNAALADVSLERLKVYKANGLIPTETNIKDIEAGKIIFSQGNYTWATGDATRSDYLKNLASKFGGLTESELSNFAWTEYSPEAAEYILGANAEDFAAYLYAIQTGEIEPPSEFLTRDKAEELKMAGYRQILNDLIYSVKPLVFKLDGTEDLVGSGFMDALLMKSGSGIPISVKGASKAQISSFETVNSDIFAALGDVNSWGFTQSDTVSWKEISNVDLSQTGLTLSNLANAEKLDNVKLGAADGYTGNLSWKEISNIDLSQTSITLANLKNLAYAQNITFGSLDLSNVNASTLQKLVNNNNDLSSCTGLTSKKLMSAGGAIYDTKLPAIDFTGVTSFEEFITSGTNVSKCTGISADAVAASGSWWDGWHVSEAQYNSWKDTLAASMSKGQSQVLYVNGKKMTIQGNQ